MTLLLPAQSSTNRQSQGRPLKCALSGLQVKQLSQQHEGGLGLQVGIFDPEPMPPVIGGDVSIFGPFAAGPEGVELYEVMMGDPRSWSDDIGSLKRWLADRGVEQLPDPPIELPAGLEDLRAVFSGEQSPAGAQSSEG